MIDLAVTFAEEPQLVRQMLAELLDDFRDGSLVPLPHRIFALPDATSAFRYMAQAKHVGKVVIAHDSAAAVESTRLIRPDGTYLITGGLGALGLHVARWLVERGGRHLVLVGRSAPSPRAAHVVEGLRQAGAQVVTVQADIGRGSDAARVLRDAVAALPALRGIIHAAGVLDDGVLLHQDGDASAMSWHPSCEARGTSTP